MINDNYITTLTNNLINQIQLSSGNEIKFVDFDFNFPITNKINFSDSLLYYISYQNKNILIAYFIVYKTTNSLKLNILDYPELFIEFDMDELNMGEPDIDSYRYYLLNKINIFIEKIFYLGKNIFNYNILIKKNFLSNQIYPTMNKIYLKSNFYKKYCVILIKEKCFMITFNDEIEDYIKIENYKLLLDCKELKIFKKNIFY
jgi:hypothetical protein